MTRRVELGSLERQAREGDVDAARALWSAARRVGDGALQALATEVVEGWLLSKPRARFRQQDKGVGEVVTLRELLTSIRSSGAVFVVRPRRLELMWSERAARLWSVDCAERVRGLVERAATDGRVARALALARRHARGEESRAALREAHGRMRAMAEALRGGGWSVVDAARAVMWATSPQRKAPGEAARAVMSARPRERRWMQERLLWYLAGGAPERAT